MRVSAKVDYALRASVELAARAGDERLVTSEEIAEAQGIPRPFLTNIMQSLSKAGIVTSRRGPDGGHELARPADAIVIADVIRAIDGPLAGVGGRHPEELEYEGTARPLKDVWVAVRASLREVLEHVTLAEIASGDLPANVTKFTTSDDSWESR